MNVFNEQKVLRNYNNLWKNKKISKATPAVDQFL